MPDQTGRVIVVTGADTAVGLVVARELARAGAHVVMGCRDLGAARAVQTSIPGGAERSEVRSLDLADLHSVRGFAAGLAGRRIDALVNSANVMGVGLTRTPQGREMHFAVNVLGHFLLTKLLLPQITDRVVWVSSIAHRSPGLDLTDLDFTRRRYSKVLAYGASKRADLMLAFQLERRLLNERSSVRSVAAHPGVAVTALHDAAGPVGAALTRKLGPWLGAPSDVAALPLLYAVTDPELPGGCFVGPDGFGEWRGHPHPVGSHASCHDPAAAAELWRRCEAMTEVDGSALSPTSHRQDPIDTVSRPHLR